MTYLLDVKQVCELEAFICQEKNVTLAELMKLAGTAVWHQLKRAYGGTPKSMVFFLGSGHNAGDGLVCAQMAINAGVDVYLYPVKPIKADLTQSLVNDLKMVFKSAWIEDVSQLQVDVAVDAMLGIGFTGELSTEIQEGICRFNQLNAFKVAIDIATGINADSGYGEYYCQVDHTITFFAAKIGHYFAQGRSASKSLIVALRQFHDGSGYHCIDEEKLPKIPAHLHKYQRGLVAVISGEQSMQGAGVMAAEAALYTGAGLVVIHALTPLHRQIHPAIMVHDYTEAGINQCVNHHAVCLVGPGMGEGEKQATIMQYLLSRDLSLVIDAQAIKHLPLNIKLESPCVLTPHIGEAAYLLNTTTHYVLNHPIEAALNIQRRYHAAVILKGSATVIAMNEQVVLMTSGSVALATAGSGDVLAGIVTGLIAQHGLSLDVLQAAVLQHANRAQAWEKISRYPMVATDLYLTRT